MWQFLRKTNAQKAEGHIRIGVLVYVSHGGVKSFIKHKIITLKVMIIMITIITIIIKIIIIIILIVITWELKNKKWKYGLVSKDLNLRLQATHVFKILLEESYPMIFIYS